MSRFPHQEGGYLSAPRDVREYPGNPGIKEGGCALLCLSPVWLGIRITESLLMVKSSNAVRRPRHADVCLAVHWTKDACWHCLSVDWPRASCLSKTATSVDFQTVPFSPLFAQYPMIFRRWVAGCRSLCRCWLPIAGRFAAFGLPIARPFREFWLPVAQVYVV